MIKGIDIHIDIDLASDYRRSIKHKMKVFDDDDEEEELFSFFDQYVIHQSEVLENVVLNQNESHLFQQHEIDVMMHMLQSTNNEILHDNNNNNLPTQNDSSENNSVINAIKVEGVKKKWKCTRRPSLRAPKIFKNDIRRKYPSMYMNVMNSLDPAMMHNFFSRFCCPHFCYERRRDEMSGVGQMSATIAPKPIYGLTRFIRTIVTFFTPMILTDLVVHVRDPKIIITKGVPGSRIVLEDTSELTLLYSLKRIPANEISQQQAQPLPAPGFEIVDPTTNDRICFSLLPKPIRVKFNAEVVFLLDESNIINGIYVTQKP